MESEELYNKVFPIKLYNAEYYKNKFGIDFTTSEKFYLAIYESCNDIKITELLMKDMISYTQILKIRNHLIKLNVIHKLNVEEAKEFCIKNSHKGIKCEWCGKESYILHKHHYPIPACENGKEIVNICPNCHYTFHTLIKED